MQLILFSLKFFDIGLRGCALEEQWRVVVFRSEIVFISIVCWQTSFQSTHFARKLNSHDCSGTVCSQASILYFRRLLRKFNSCYVAAAERTVRINLKYLLVD